MDLPKSKILMTVFNHSLIWNLHNRTLNNYIINNQEQDLRLIYTANQSSRK